MDDASLTPSLLDLYKKSANPQKTNLDRLKVEETPFVKSRESGGESVYSRRSQSSRRSDRSRDERSRRSVSSGHSEREPPESDDGHNEEAPAFFTSQQRVFADRNAEHEKAMLLNEYNRLRQGGSNCGRALTHNDNLADIRFELNRVKNDDDCASTVSVMKDFIKLGTTFVELGNKKMNLLKLNGPAGNWSQECTKDMARFDRCLTKLYQRYIRKGSVSPILELALLLIGPMVVCHFKNSMAGPALPSSTSRPSRNVPFQKEKKTPFTGQSQPPQTSVPFSRPAMPTPFSGQRQAMPQPQQPMRQAMPQPQQMRQAMPQPQQMRQPMPQPQQMRQAMPQPQQMRQAMPQPQMTQAMPQPQQIVRQAMPQPMRQTMPQPVAAHIEVNINEPKRRNSMMGSLEIVEENEGSEESDHTSIDIREDANEIQDDMDSSSVGSFTF